MKLKNIIQSSISDEFCIIFLSGERTCIFLVPLTALSTVHLQSQFETDEMAATSF